MGTTSFRELRVWQTAHKVALSIYQMTRTFPKDELYGLTTQMRRAAVSIAANIAEGYGRRKPNDKMRFYNMSEGSAQELEYFLILAQDLGYASTTEELQGSVGSVSRMLRKLIEAMGGAP